MRMTKVFLSTFKPTPSPPYLCCSVRAKGKIAHMYHTAFSIIRFIQDLKLAVLLIFLWRVADGNTMKAD